MNYQEIEISHSAMISMTPMKLSELDLFFKTHSGWEMFDHDYTGSRIIRFTSPESFKQFFVQFAESKVGHALPIRESIDELQKVLITRN